MNQKLLTILTQCYLRLTERETVSVDVLKVMRTLLQEGGSPGGTSV